ncbi:MAG: hypothetical protein ACTSQ8_07900 [Candidatus Helarchaeota archaeon]
MGRTLKNTLKPLGTTLKPMRSTIKGIPSDKKRTRAIKEVRKLFKELKAKDRMKPAWEGLAKKRTKQRELREARSKDYSARARKGKRKKKHVLERREARATGKVYKTPTIQGAKDRLNELRRKQRAKIELKHKVKGRVVNKEAILKAGAKRARKNMAPPGLRSAAIESLGYDMKTQQMAVKYHQSSTIYIYPNVSYDLFVQVYSGNDWCRTSGSNPWGKWWRTKRPSVGAAMYWNVGGGTTP